jgi:proline dehydrogenase
MSDIFEQAAAKQEGTDPVEQPVAETPQPETPPQVAVEYNGKVWTQEDILNKFKNADDYINQLKEENEKLAQQATKGATLDEVLNHMNQQDVQPQPVENTTQATPTVDVESVARQAFEKYEQEKVLKQNLEASISKLQASYGDKTVEVLQSKAAELDMSLEEAKALASTKPKAFERMFLDAKPKSVASTQGTVNTQTLQQTNQQERPKLYKLKGEEYVKEFNKRLAEKLAN